MFPKNWQHIKNGLLILFWFHRFGAWQAWSFPSRTTAAVSLTGNCSLVWQSCLVFPVLHTTAVVFYKASASYQVVLMGHLLAAVHNRRLLTAPWHRAVHNSKHRMLIFIHDVHTNSLDLLKHMWVACF